MKVNCFLCKKEIEYTQPYPKDEQICGDCVEVIRLEDNLEEAKSLLSNVCCVQDENCKYVGSALRYIYNEDKELTLTRLTSKLDSEFTELNNFNDLNILIENVIEKIYLNSKKHDCDLNTLITTIIAGQNRVAYHCRRDVATFCIFHTKLKSKIKSEIDECCINKQTLAEIDIKDNNFVLKEFGKILSMSLFEYSGNKITEPFLICGYQSNGGLFLKGYDGGIILNIDENKYRILDDIQNTDKYYINLNIEKFI